MVKCPKCSSTNINKYYNYNPFECVLHLQCKCQDCGNIFAKEKIENYYHCDDEYIKRELSRD